MTAETHLATQKHRNPTGVHSPLSVLGSSFSVLLSFQVSSAKKPTDSDLYFHILNFCPSSVAWGGYQGEDICQHLWRGRSWDRGSNKQYLLTPPLISLLRYCITILNSACSWITASSQRQALSLPDAGGTHDVLSSPCRTRAGFLGNQDRLHATFYLH